MGFHAMVQHEAAERCAIGAEILLLEGPRFLLGDPEMPGDELAHALVDLGEQIDVGRIERIVEIKDPVADMRQPPRITRRGGAIYPRGEQIVFSHHKLGPRNASRT